MPRLSEGRKAALTAVMKESIFQATTAVLCEHGIEGTTMNRVAAAAKVAKSSLYDYFRGKDELLAFVSDRIVTPFLQALDEIISAPGPATQKLQTILRMAFESGAKYKAVLRLLSESDQERRLKSSIRPRILRAFAAIFEQGIRQGEFHPHNPAHTGRMFHGAMSELFELQVSNASDEEVSEYLAVLIDAVVHGVSIHVDKNRPSCDANPHPTNP